MNGSAISIRGISKAKVLAALFNASKPQGMGFWHPLHDKELTVGDAREIIEQTDDLYFDYLNGRVMKVDLNGDAFDPSLYDRDNGDGAAARAVAALTKGATE